MYVFLAARAVFAKQSVLRTHTRTCVLAGEAWGYKYDADPTLERLRHHTEVARDISCVFISLRRTPNVPLVGCFMFLGSVNSPILERPLSDLGEVWHDYGGQQEFPGRFFQPSLALNAARPSPKVNATTR